MVPELRVKPYTLCSACYDKPDVDAVIEAKDAKILHLQAEVMLQKHHADVFMEERNAAEKTVRMLYRALYKACANWADVVAFEETEGIGYDNCVAERWRNMERKCLKKAEEYK